MPRWLPILSLFLSFAFITTPPTRADDDEPTAAASRKKVREKYRAILERDPYHDLALTKLLQFAAEENAIEPLVEEFQSLVEESPKDPGYRFILASIYQRSDRLVEAVTELRAVPEENDRCLGLLGEIYTYQGEFSLAAEALENAADLAKGEKSLRRLYRSIGSLHLAQGEKEKAILAFRRIVEIDPGSFYLRQGVAETLAEAGLLEEALSDYRALADLAGADASKRCAVLREMGSIHERRKELDEALRQYTAAADLLRRGNWMKEDIQGRIIRVHRERGTLDALERECRDRIQATPQLIDPHVLLGRVLEEKGEADRSAEALRRATEQFPDDLELGKRLIALLGDLGAVQGQVEEYQRLIARRPGEIDLYLELGRLFAREEKFSQAKLQWERIVARDVQDAGLCLRLAELYAQYHLVDDAIRSYEQAIQIAPGEKSYPIALGSYLYSLDRKEEARQRWMAIGELGPESEVTLAEILLGHGFPRDALAVAGEARDAGRKDARLYLLLGDIHRALDDTDSAKAAARRAADLAKTNAIRDEAVIAIVSLHESAGTLGRMVETEEAAKGADDPVPYLILGEAFVRTRQTSRAVDVYRQLLETAPGEVDVVERLADLYLAAGDLDGSVESFERVLALRPGKERPIFKKLGKIHLRREDREKAFETWKRMIRAQPENPVVYKEVAKEYQRLGLLDESIRHYRQALERSPADPVEVRLDLAEVLANKRDQEAAAVELTIALGEAKTGEERRNVRKRLFKLHRRMGTLEQEIEDLEGRVEENPYDVEGALLLADFFLRGYEYGRAIEMLDRVIPFQRGNAALLMQKARLLIEMEEHASAIEVFQEALKLKGSHKDDALERMGESFADLGDREGAAEAWASMSDRLREAELLREHQMAREALLRYETLLARSPGDPDLWLEKARVLRKMGDQRASVKAYQRVLEADPTHRDALRELGALWMDLKEKEDAVECGKRLLGSREVEKKKRKPGQGDLIYDSYGGYWYSAGRGRSKRSTLQLGRAYFQKHGLLPEFAEILVEEVRQNPRQIEALLALGMMYERELGLPEKALEVYRRILGQEWDHDEFTHAYRSLQRWWRSGTYARAQDPEEEVWGLIQGIYARRADLREERLEILSGLGERTREETLELAALYSQAGMQDQAGETLQAATENLPESPRFVSLLAKRAAAGDEHEEAVRHYRMLLDRVRRGDPGMTEKEETKLRVQTRNSIPYYIRDNATKAQIEEVVDLVVRERKRSRSINLWVSSERNILAALARSAFKANDPGRATEALDEILTLGDDFLNLSFVAVIHFNHERYDEAEELYLKAREAAEERGKNPVHEWYYRRNPGGISGYSIRNLGLIYKKRGEFLRAYDFLREAGYTTDAWAAYKEGKLEEEARNRYRVEREETRLELEAAEDRGGRESALEKHLTATIKLAEILEEEDEVPLAIRIYEEAMELCTPDIDLPLRSAVAALHEKERRFDEAIEARRKMIALKKEMNLNIALYRERKGLPLEPQHTGPTSSSFRYSRRSYSRRSPGRFATRFETRQDYFAIADLHVNRGDAKAGVRALMKYFRENPGQSGYTWEIQRFAQAHDLQAEILPLFRLFGMEKAKSPWQKRDYARALEKAGQWEEAIEQYESILTDFPGTAGENHLREAEKKLKTLYQRTGLLKEVLASLAAAVEESPRNVKKRLKLVRIYQAQGMHPEAAEHLVILREEAPYLPDVHALSRRVHLALGQRPAAILDLKEEIELRSGSQDRLRLHYILGNLLDLEGDEAESHQAWMETVSPQDANSYLNLGNLLLELRREDLAKKVFEDGIEAGAKYSWRGTEVVQKAARLAFWRGDYDEGMRLLDEIKEMEPGFVYRLFGGSSDVLQISLDPTPLIETLRKRAEAKPEDADSWMLLAAAHFAYRQVREGVEVLERALEARPHSQEILKMLVDEHDAMGDLGGAIAFGERWVDSLPADSQSFAGSRRPGPYGWRYGDSGTTSKKEGYAELAGLHRRAGNLDQAKELIRKLEEKTRPHSYLRLADTFDKHRFYPEAVEAMRTFLEKAPDRQAQHLVSLSHYLGQDGKPAEALDALREALGISTDEREQRRIYQAMEAIYREERNPEDLLDQLKAKLEEEPKDLPILLFLGRVYRDQGEAGESESYLRRAAEAHPSNKVPLRELVRLYTQERDRAKAVATLEKLIQVVPSEKKKWSTQLGDLFFQEGEKERAIDAWTAGIGDPGSYYSQQRLGNTLSRHELYAEAAEAYRESLRLAPYNRDLSSIRTNLAEALLRGGKSKEALDAYRKEFEEMKSPGSLGGSGEVLRFLFRQESVREHLSEIRSKPLGDLSTEEAATLGLERLFSDDFEEAARIFRERLEGDVDEEVAWRGLYLASIRGGDLDGALAACRGWVEAEERGEGQVSIILWTLGDLFQRLGRGEEAMSTWRLAQRTGRWPLYDYNSRRYYRRSNQHGSLVERLSLFERDDEAREEIERGLALGMLSEEEALRGSAQALRRRGEVGRALEFEVEASVLDGAPTKEVRRAVRDPEKRDSILQEVRRRLDLQPRDRSPLRLLAALYREVDEPLQAIAIYRKACEREKDDPSLRMVMAAWMVKEELHEEALPILEELWKSGVRSSRSWSGSSTYYAGGVRYTTYRYDQGRWRVDRKRPGELLTLVYTALGKEAEAADVAAELMRGYVRRTHAFYAETARSLQYHEMYPEALQLLEKAMETCPEEVDDPKGLKNLLHEYRGSKLGLLKKLDRMDEAAALARDHIAKFEEDLRETPWGAETYLSISTIHQDYTKDWEAALEAAERYAETTPFSTNALVARAWVLLRMGRVDEAAKAFEKTQELRDLLGERREATLLLGRALAAHRLGKGEEARRHLDEAEELFGPGLSKWNDEEFEEEIDAIHADES